MKNILLFMGVVTLLTTTGCIIVAVVRGGHEACEGPPIKGSVMEGPPPPVVIVRP